MLLMRFVQRGVADVMGAGGMAKGFGRRAAAIWGGEMGVAVGE